MDGRAFPRRQVGRVARRRARLGYKVEQFAGPALLVLDQLVLIVLQPLLQFRPVRRQRRGLARGRGAAGRQGEMRGRGKADGGSFGVRANWRFCGS